MNPTIDLSSLFLPRIAQSRSLSAENYRGEPGEGGRTTIAESTNPEVARYAQDLGTGWKVSPCLRIPPHSTATIMDHAGPGVIRHLWFTFHVMFQRQLIIRIYWDDQEHPSIECPLGDFFCNAWGQCQTINAMPINTNPNGGLNCFFPMPFKRHCRITVENATAEDLRHFFYTIDYTLEPVPTDCLSFHAQFRRTNPLPEGEVYAILDGVKGNGHYVGTYVAWRQSTAGWWGEGEVKMYIDDDEVWPTICGTGIEDYFGGAYNFGATDFSAPFFGFKQVVGESEHAGTRMTMHRFHLHDPVFFTHRLRVTLQALGWGEGNRYRTLPDDIASVAYWYQTLPTAPFPIMPDAAKRTTD